MAIDVRLPSINGPTDSQRITQISRYLYQLAEDLKYNLNILEAGTSDTTSIERIGIIDSLDDWKLKIDGAQISIATIRQKVSSQGASIELLTEWKSGVEGDVSSIASIKQRADANGASIELLTEWKSGVEGDVSSIASIKQRADANGASIETLTQWKSGVEDDVSSIASIEQRVSDAESAIKLLTELNAGDTTSLAELVNRVSATEASITGLTEWKNGVNSSVTKIEQISTEDLASITGLAEWKSDLDGVSSKSVAEIKQTAENVKASISLVVDNGKVKGGILIEAINDESVAKISSDRLNIEGKTLNIKVASTNIVGGLTIGQLPSNVATREDIPTDVGDLTNSAGYQTVSGVVSIIDGRITADFIKTLGLEVGNHIKMGTGAKISWESVESKPTNLATTTDVGDAKAEAVNEIKNLGYQTQSQVKTEISESKIRTDQIECTDLNAFGATIGGFTIDNNSIHSSMSSTSNRILLCSGTSARYVVGGHSSTGWSIIAGSNFGVLKDGTMYASGANISGHITATSGLIGGFKIDNGLLHSTEGVYGTYNYTTTGTNSISKTGYAFTVLAASGIYYYIKQSNDFDSETLAIIHTKIGGSGISGEDDFTTET